MKNEQLIKALRNINCNGSPTVLTDCCDDDAAAYNERRQVFNRKFQFRPTAIVLCENTEQVSEVIKIVNEYDCVLRVRSGGHDHEGESGGTDTVVIDFSKMNNAEVDHTEGVARIQPGAIFKNLIKVLNANNVGIPHGTCGTVGIAGFTMGGGWGPWTRSKGMCCESLVGATIVLGDGTIKTLTVDGEDKELLWALRGGGGMSYGVVTELVIKTFELPPNTIKFNVEWDSTPALQVLKKWESLIAPDANPNLLGTNLKIVGTPEQKVSVEESIHECVFYGYYAGSEEELWADIDRWFHDLPYSDINIPNALLRAQANNAEDVMADFSLWDRISTTSTKRKLLGQERLQLIPPDTDAPAPHKISSKLVKPEGLGDEGHELLIRSLESSLISQEGEMAGIHCYVTLGAISGMYYRDYKPGDHPLGSAFPYKTRPYTIQYQAWWNQGEEEIAEGQEYDVYRYVNRAQDWIETCRSQYFPQTEGSFISFKDDSIPTENYFLQSYEDLKRIKLTYSKDPKNRFRTRKTII